MNRKLLFLLFALLTTLFFACSGDDGDNDSTDESSSSSVDWETSSSSGDGGDTNAELTSTYKIKNITENSFIVEDTFYDCYQESFNNNGELVIENEEDKVNYSINNNTIALEDFLFNDGMSFSGTAKSLIGSTWTREPNVCIEDEENKIWCFNDHFSKIAFTNTTLTITYDMCWTKNYFDREKGTYEKDGGVTLKIIDCNTSEASYGNHKATTTFVKPGTNSFIQVTYNQTTCSGSSKNSSESEKKAACKAAYNRVKDEGGDYEDMSQYYEEATGINFREIVECLKEAGMPEELEGDILG